jgi:hypothetical protein
MRSFPLPASGERVASRVSGEPGEGALMVIICLDGLSYDFLADARKSTSPRKGGEVK